MSEVESPQTTPPAEEGDDQDVSEGTDTPQVEEGDFEDAPEHDDDDGA